MVLLGNNNIKAVLNDETARLLQNQEYHLLNDVNINQNPNEQNA